MTAVAFDWNAAKAAGNAVKHGVTFDEASTMFLDALALTITDLDSDAEERWVSGTGPDGTPHPRRAQLDREGWRKRLGSHHLGKATQPP